MDNSATSSTAAAAVDMSDVADGEGDDIAHDTSPTMGTTKKEAETAKKRRKSGSLIG